MSHIRWRKVRMPLVFGLFCLVLFGAYQLLVLATSGPPRIEVAKEHIFGPFGNDGQESVQVPIRNGGAKLLEVEAVKTGCACLGYALPQRFIEPGETVMMDVTYKLDGKPSGVNREVIYIKSNDPETPVLKAFLNFELRGWWNLLPEKLLVYGKKGEVREDDVTILNQYDLSEKIVSVRSTSDLVTPVLEKPRVFEGSGAALYLVRLKSRFDFEGKKTVCNIIVETDSARNPELTGTVELIAE